MSADTKKGTRKLVLSVLFISIFVFTAFAETHTIENSEFSLSGFYNNNLFPETDYSIHPSVLSSLTKKLTLLDLSIVEDYTWKTAERLDTTQGAIGGLKKDQDFYLLGSFSFLSLVPKENMLHGWGLSGQVDWRHLKTEANDYDTPTQQQTTETITAPFSLGAAYLWVGNKDNTRLGYSVNYDFSFRKAFFSWITDNTIDPVLKYVEYTGDDADQYDHSAAIRGDWGRTLGNVDITFGAAYKFGYRDRNKRYKLLDIDEDGFYEKVQDYTEWFSGWVAENVLTADQKNYSLSQKDTALSHTVDLDLVLRFMLSKDLELILQGSYTPLDYSLRNYHDRQTSNDVLIDESEDTEIRSQDWGNFSAGLVLKTNPDKRGWTWRYGAFYERSAKTLLLEGVQASDINKYSRINTGNYTEMALGLNPVKGTVANSGIDASLEIDHLVTLLGGWEWRVSKDVRLFSSLEITGDYGVDHYRAFNTDTNTVWEEKVAALNISWTAVPKIGLMLPLGEKRAWVGELSGFNYPGSYSQTSDTAPYDLIAGRKSEDGSVDLTQKGGLGFNITMRFVVLP